MIILVGESASGKSTIEKELVKLGVEKITSYTTRPIRDGEVDGVDYHFISEREFKQWLEEGFFAEHTSYRDWFYGTAGEDCKENTVLVANPHGLRQIQRMEDISVHSFYVKTSGRERLVRMLKRGDDIMECFRRYFSDSGTFQNIEEEIDMILDGHLHVNFLAKMVLSKVKEDEDNR